MNDVYLSTFGMLEMENAAEVIVNAAAKEGQKLAHYVIHYDIFDHKTIPGFLELVSRQFLELSPMLPPNGWRPKGSFVASDAFLERLAKKGIIQLKCER